jgi:hypothetical protein
VPSELILIRHLLAVIHERWQVLRTDSEAGYTTETVVVTALLVAMAIAVVAIIVVKVTATANNISTGGS